MICDDRSVTTSFSQLLHSGRGAAGTLAFDIPDDWMQGRSAFGGLQVALALQAMRAVVPTAPLRTLQATFVAPVGGQLTARATVLRTGKSATHVEARLGDGAETAAIVIGVFGSPRSSVVSVTPRRTPSPVTMDLELPFIPGVVPNFTQHFQAHWSHGAPPFTGSSEPRHTVTVGMRGEARASEAHLVAIADFIPPIGLSYLASPAPGSTLTWMLEVLRDRLDDQPAQGWIVDAELFAARDGYTSQAVTLWAPDGEIAAVSRQSMLVFG